MAWALQRTLRVLLSGARELSAPQPALRAEQIPRSPGEIRPEWLTSVLCGETPGARVTAVRALGAGVGTSTRATLELAYNQAGAAAGLPARVFVKCTSSLAQRLMLGLGGFIAGEPGFYTQVRPGLEIEAPRGYFAALDEASWRSIVVLEDVVHTRGAAFWEPSTKVTRGQIETLVAEVAGWHGALWASPRLPAWPWLKTPAEQMRRIDALLGLADRRAAGAIRARSVIPSAILDRQADLLEGMRRSMRAASLPPHTYLHGDLHIANTYAVENGRTGIADWQTGLRGCWAYDYAYILATAVEVEDRRAWERELLAVYLDRLSTVTGAPIPFNRAWEAYRRSLFYPYFAWLYTIGRSRLQPSFQPRDVSLTMIKRVAAAIADLDSLGAVGL